MEEDNKTDRGRIPIETLIQSEIERRLKKKSWNQLDMCFKWRLVAAFLAENGLYDGMSVETKDGLRGKIRKNELEGVEYDNATMKIVSMKIDAESSPVVVVV